MGNFFVSVFRFLQGRKWLLYLILLTILLISAWFITMLKMDEEISRTRPGDRSESFTDKAIREMKFTDKLILHLSLDDPNLPPDPDRLVRFAENLTDSLRRTFNSGYIKSVQPDASDTSVAGLIRIMTSNIPLFLEEEDYRVIDTLITEEAIQQAMQKNIRLLNTPAGMFMRERLTSDPLGFSGIVLKKLNYLKAGEQYTIYRDYIFTQDLKHLLVFINTANPASETAKNGSLTEGIRTLALHFKTSDPEVSARIWGGPAIAAGNAEQLRKDVMLTVTLALLLIFLLIGWYFRSLLIPLLSMLPALFGGLTALAWMYLIKGTISAIALGIGSVLLGLIVDYALYIINYFRRTGSVEQSLKDLSQSIIVCCLTSVGAFLCLLFLDSAVLYDLGLFASLSLAGAAIFALIFLPHFLGKKLVRLDRSEKTVLIDRIAAVPFEKMRWLSWGIIAAGVISLFFLGRVSFERDMNALNFVNDELADAGRRLDSISDLNLKTVYVVTRGQTLDQALDATMAITGPLDRLKEQGVIRDYSGLQSLMISESAQDERIERWNKYWTREKRTSLQNSLTKAASDAGIKASVMKAFLGSLEKPPTRLSKQDVDLMSTGVLREWIINADREVLVSTMVKVTEANRKAVYTAVEATDRRAVFDRQYITDQFVEGVRGDFNKLVGLTMIFVTLLLILSFGRIETGLVASLPMFLAWLLTLGFMGMTGIRFNIFNIIISSFVFGLGVDYSILMARAILHEYKYGEDISRNMKVSVLLSSATTIIGVAVLLLAKHPALSSIALVSIVGVSLVALVTLTLEPVILHWMLTTRKRKRQFPLTLRILFHAIVIAWIPISLIAMFLVIYAGLIAPLLPVSRKKKEKLFHLLFSRLSKIYIAMNFPRHHSVENLAGEDFSKPCIIISNHQSLIETPALLRLHPKILILANEWIFHNFVFGPVARAAGFIPITGGIDESLDTMRSKISEGYSILIFPEGHRSPDGHIQRFHRGAFYIAEKLKLDLLPIVIFGSGDFLQKGAFWGKPNRLFMKILPRITPADVFFGSSYSERTRQVRKYYKEEYARFRAEHGSTKYYQSNVRLNYIFKGPVLEWYVRIKMRLENNFRSYDEHLPKVGTIVDLGCGYGYMTYMLHYTSPARTITGVDYDQEKISVALQCFSKNERISFLCADITETPLDKPDGIILGDVLHYLEPQRQSELLIRCFRNLSPEGTILIREGIVEDTGHHERTRLTEFLSTRLGFNKTRDPSKNLFFLSEGMIRKLAVSENMIVSIISEKDHTSNKLFRIRHAE